jgi:hypothetical protein
MQNKKWHTHIVHIFSFGQFQGLTRLFLVSLRSYDGRKMLEMRVMHANNDVFLYDY